MDALKILRFLIFLISLVMFCYQLNTATLNLIDPPTVLSQFERDITSDDMPLVTICPTNQTNTTRLVELGYEKYLDMLEGRVGHRTSWGEHVKLTFDGLKNEIIDLDRLDRLHVKGGEFKYGHVFIPGYGLCRETLTLNYTQEIKFLYNNPDDARVLVTDRNYRSYFMPNVASHVGKKIFMEPHTEHYINVKIQEKYNCKNNDDLMMERDFKKCVDYNIQEEFKQNNINCVPPWLSDNNQCNQTYPKPWKFYGKFEEHFQTRYVKKMSMIVNIQFEEECKQSCKETTYIVIEEGTVKGDGKERAKAIIAFHPKVVVTQTVPNYDMFKYIIDVGSSLGLWLGLSVFGLHDLVVMAVQSINNSYVVKKIRSAATK